MRWSIVIVAVCLLSLCVSNGAAQDLLADGQSPKSETSESNLQSESQPVITPPSQVETPEMDRSIFGDRVGT